MRRGCAWLATGCRPGHLVMPRFTHRWLQRLARGVKPRTFGAYHPGTRNLARADTSGRLSVGCWWAEAPEGRPCRRVVLPNAGSDGGCMSEAGRDEQLEQCLDLWRLVLDDVRRRFRPDLVRAHNLWLMTALARHVFAATTVISSAIRAGTGPPPPARCAGRTVWSYRTGRRAGQKERRLRRLFRAQPPAVVALILQSGDLFVLRLPSWWTEGISRHRGRHRRHAVGRNRPRRRGVRFPAPFLIGGVRPRPGRLPRPPGRAFEVTPLRPRWFRSAGPRRYGASR